MKFQTDLFESKDIVLIGVSGGLDSVVLLDCLAGLRQELGLTLYLAHLNHQIRGASALRDVEFVRELAAKYQLEYILGVRDIPRFAKEHRLSLEDAAREVRYDFLLAEAVKIGAGKIAVAHNLDDQLETIVMRFLRGSASRGLSGMPAVRSIAGAELVRPLLQTSRQDIAAYAREKNLAYQEDETNRETIYLRNKIRLELLPKLKEFNPNLAETLPRMAEILREEDIYLEQLAAEAYRDLVLQENAERIKIDKVALAHYPKAIQRRVVRQALEKLTGYLDTVSLAYVENFLQNKLSLLELDAQGKLLVSKD